MTVDSFSQKVSKLTQSLEGLQAEFKSCPANAPEILADALDSLHTSIEDLQVAEKVLKRLNAECIKSTEESADALALAHSLQVHKIELEMQNEELKQARLETENALAKYSDLYDFSPIGLFTLNIDGQILEANLTGAALLGMERGSLMNKRFAKFVAIKDYRLFDDFCKSALVTSDKQSCELRLLKYKGPEIYVRIEGKATEECTMDEKQFRIAIADITERKRAEEALKASEEKYRTIVETANEGIIVTDAGSLITYANDKFAEMLGYRPEEMIGRNSIDFYDKDYTALALSKREQRRQFGAKDSFEFKLICKDGSSLWALVNTSPLMYKDGKYAGTLGMLTDITERVHLNEALSKNERKYRSIVEQSKDGIVLTDETGRIAEWNAGAETIIGLDKANALGRPVWDVQASLTADEAKADDLAAALKKMTTDLLTTGISPLLSQPSEYAIRRPDGTRVIVEEILCTIPTERGFMFSSTLRDISERVRAEEALRESEENYRLLVESSGSIILQTDLNMRITFLNQYGLQFFGYTPEEIIGKKSIGTIIPQKDGEGHDIASMAEDLIRHPDKYPINVNQNMRKDGGLVWVSWTNKPIYDNQGNLIEVLSIGNDLTRLKEAEAALMENERIFRDAIDHFPNVFVIYDADRRIQKINSKGLEILGLSEQDVIGRKDEEIFPPHMINSYLPALKLAVETKTHQTLERKRHSSMGGQNIAITIIPLLNEKRDIRQILAISHDISEHKRIEDELEQSVRERTAELMKANLALAESEDRFRVALKNSPIAVFNQDKDLRYTWVYLQNLALITDEILGKTDEDLFPHEEAAEMTKIKRRVLQSGFGERAEVQATINGETFFHDLTVEPLCNLIGEIEGITCSSVDITYRKRAEEALRQAWAYNRSLIEASLDPLVTIGPDGKITDVNAATEEVTGYRFEELVGTDFSDYFTDPDSVHAVYQQVFKDGYVRDYPLTIRHRDGRLTDVLYNASVYKDTEGKVLGIFAAARDITERKRAETELRRSKDITEAALRAKSEFLAVMSHELRTPLNGILGMASLLAMDNLSSEQHECIDVIKSSSESLLVTINDILNFAKVESGKVVMERKPFNLRGSIYDALNLLFPNAKSKGLDIACSIDRNAPDAIISDQARLKQVLLNLLDNAVKFTDKGRIDVSVSSRDLQDDRCEILFSIIDTGIGISESDIQKLFQPFSQVDMSNTRKYGGTGLGLAVSKGLVEMMGGKIWVESQIGQGSAFYFTIVAGVIPIVPFDSPEIALQAKTLENSLVKNRRVLLAEDNQMNRTVTLRMLKRLGYMADAVASGREAIESLERQHYDIVLMDVQMSDIDGLEATKQIRKLWPISGPKIIALTAHALKGDKERCIEAGMDDYIAKPVAIGELAEILSRYSPHRE